MKSEAREVYADRALTALLIAALVTLQGGYLPIASVWLSWGTDFISVYFAYRLLIKALRTIKPTG